MRSMLLVACASLIGTCVSAGVFAQNYPVKQVRIIVPTPAGGNPDFVARPVAQKMSENLKQIFLIDNRPGAAGTIGAELRNIMPTRMSEPMPFSSSMATSRALAAMISPQVNQRSLTSSSGADGSIPE